MNTAVGTFLSSDAGVTLPFTPKFLMFFWTDENSADEVYGADSTGTIGIGITDGTNSWSCLQSTLEWANATRTGAGQWDDAPITHYTRSSGSMDLKARALVSFLSNGFALNWTTVAATAFRLNYLAIGGDLKAKVGTVDLLTTDVGTDKPVTGMSFSPKTLMTFVSMGRGGTIGTTGSSSGMCMAVGAASQASGNQVCASGSPGLAGANQAYIGRCIQYNDDSQFSRTAATLKTWDASGFTLTVNQVENTQRVGYVAFDMPSVLGTDNLPGSDATGRSYTGMAYRPDGVISFGSNRNSWGTNSQASSAPAGMSIGAWDGVSQRGVGAGGYGNLPTHSGDHQESALLGSGSDSAYNGVVYGTSLNPDGFTVNWDYRAASAAMGWLAFSVPATRVASFDGRQVR